MKNKMIKGALCAAAALLAFNACAAASRPNIVFLMTDDQRWDTLGCYGRTDVLTPHIDQLSEQGVTFDNAYYAVAICMPSRTTMFTGRYFADHQVGFTYPYNRTLPAEEFAESYPAKLKEAGYRTGFVGKFGIRLENTPKTAAQYFDFFAAGRLIWPKGDTELRNIFRGDRPKTERTLKKGDAMIRFLETQPKGQPFCLSISFDAVKNDQDRDMHIPHVALFKDKKMWVPENWVEGKNMELPKVLDHCRGTYLHVARTSTPEQYQATTRRFAVQGYTVDQQVGRLMAKLKEMDVLDNTIVIYTSDNGCSKAANIPALRKQGHTVSAQYRGSKADLWEGGHRVPFLVRWPSKVESGSMSDQLITLVDVFATVSDITGEKAPAMAEDSVSFLPALSGQAIQSTRKGVIHHSIFGHFAYRQGKWKLLLAKASGGWTSPKENQAGADAPQAQLYDMENDPGEKNNLHLSHPEVAQRLLANLTVDVQNGRSTDGPAAKNDVEQIVLWKSQRTKGAKPKR